MKKVPPRNVLHENAKQITDLHSRIHDTVKLRDKSLEARTEWESACREFHSRYDALAFPGGYQAGLEKIQAGDPYAIENAIAFIEVKPYFFRSGYMRTKLIRLLKHADLNEKQKERFRMAIEKVDRKAYA